MQLGNIARLVLATAIVGATTAGLTTHRALAAQTCRDEAVGVTFSYPDGWFAHTGGTAVVLSYPDKEYYFYPKRGGVTMFIQRLPHTVNAYDKLRGILPVVAIKGAEVKGPDANGMMRADFLEYVPEEYRSTIVTFPRGESFVYI